MNVTSWLLWGFAATLVLTTISAVLQGLGLTRMNIPFMLGAIFTADRDRAKLYGFLVHVAAGWAFSLFYVLIFQALGSAGWWRGAVIGVIHAMFVLMVVTAILPGLHPRMASEQHGPQPHSSSFWIFRRRTQSIDSGTLRTAILIDSAAPHFQQHRK